MTHKPNIYFYQAISSPTPVNYPFKSRYFNHLKNGSVD
jgi:hypothetical protein